MEFLSRYSRQKWQQVLHNTPWTLGLNSCTCGRYKVDRNSYQSLGSEDPSDLALRAHGISTAYLNSASVRPILTAFFAVTHGFFVCSGWSFMIRPVHLYHRGVHMNRGPQIWMLSVWAQQNVNTLIPKTSRKKAPYPSTLASLSHNNVAGKGFTAFCWDLPCFPTKVFQTLA